MSNFESQLISCLKALDPEDLRDLAALIDETLLFVDAKDLSASHKEDYERDLNYIAEIIAKPHPQVIRLVDMEELNKVIKEDYEKVQKVISQRAERLYKEREKGFWARLWGVR